MPTVRGNVQSPFRLRKQRVLQSCLPNLTKAVRVSVLRQKAQARTAAEIRQPAGEVESRASASTAARTAECGAQTDFALGFTRMTSPEEYMPTPTVRIVETPYEGPFFCTASSQGKIHIDSHCWGLRNVPHPQQREMCANCLARLRAQTR